MASLAFEVDQLIEESLSFERAGDISQAFQRARQALEAARTTGEPEAIASSLACEAYLQFRTSDFERARSLAGQVLELTAEGSPAYVDALLVLGICACETDNLDVGEENYRRVISISRQFGDRLRLFRGLHNLSAGVYMSRGQFDLSVAAAEEALHIATVPELQEWAWLPLCIIARISWISGDPVRARENLARLSAAARSGSLAEGYLYCARASLAMEEGDPEIALMLFHQARSTADAIGDLGLIIDTRLGLCRCQLASENAAAAFAWADDALAASRRCRSHYLQAMALIMRGRSAMQMADLDRAESDFREAIAIAEPLKDYLDLAKARLSLAVLLHTTGKPKAQSLWLEALHDILRGGYSFLLEQDRSHVYPLALNLLENTQSSAGDPQSSADLEAALSYLENLPPPPLEVRLLGNFSVRQGGVRIPDEDWHRPIVRRLFVYFVLHRGQVLPRDQILDDLWPDSDPASAVATFNTVQSRLRHILDPYLRVKKPCRYFVVEGNNYLFDPDQRTHTDLERFQDAVHQGMAKGAGFYSSEDLPVDFLQALREWQPFLPGFPYEDWLVAGRERVQECYLEGCLFTANVFLAQDKPSEGVDWANRIVQIAPWFEEGYQVLMRAYGRMGDRTRGLRVYEDAVKALRKELDIAPSELTDRLAANLRQDRSQ